MGVSKVVNTNLIAQNTRVGTPLYLSPELVKQKPYDFKIDMWAFGCVLYHLCALAPPFYGENLISLGYNIVHKSQKPIPSMYTTGLEKFIWKLLDKGPATRPSANEAMHLIAQFSKTFKVQVSSKKSMENLTRKPIFGSRKSTEKFEIINSKEYKELLKQEIILPLDFDKV
jgi:hypothetical protein